jgi:hypothetical protein
MAIAAKPDDLFCLSNQYLHRAFDITLPATWFHAAEFVILHDGLQKTTMPGDYSA